MLAVASKDVDVIHLVPSGYDNVSLIIVCEVSYHVPYSRKIWQGLQKMASYDIDVCTRPTYFKAAPYMSSYVLLLELYLAKRLKVTTIAHHLLCMHSTE